jgi:hypothetical protein
MDTNRPASVTDAIEQLDYLIERELDAPFARALLETNLDGGDPGPCWRDLAEQLRRAAGLADWLAANDR